MVSRILSIIGVIIILLSLCALLFFPTPTRSFARGFMQGENLVDNDVSSGLVSEADAIAVALRERADAASDQPELDPVVAESTAQADLINMAATESNREALIAALQAAADRITSQMEVAQVQAAAQTATAEAQVQAAQAEATASAAAQLTAEAQPTPTPVPPTDTPTPIPPTETPVPTPGTLPDTGAVLQVVPTVVVAADWPKLTEVNQSDFIRVTLVQISEGVYAPTVEAGVEHEVVAVTPKAVPNSTPQVPIQSAFGEGYNTFAVARLSYGGTVFEVSEPEPRARQSLDRSEISWTWNVTPKESGRHIVNLVVEVEWEPTGEGGKRPEPYTIWAPDLTINVAKPPLIVAGQLSVLSIVGMILGSALNVPFLYKVLQDRRKKPESGG